MGRRQRPGTNLDIGVIWFRILRIITQVQVAIGSGANRIVSDCERASYTI
jgi:hypothetical protein